MKKAAAQQRLFYSIPSTHASETHGVRLHQAVLSADDLPPHQQRHRPQALIETASQGQYNLDIPAESYTNPFLPGLFPILQ